VARVVIEKASRAFGPATTRVCALDEIDLSIGSGELLLLTGPSGSGKTTLLRAIAGLEPLDSGDIFFDGKSMAAVPPHLRNVAMVFQDPALYPHMTVGQNLEFGLKLRKCAAAERSRRISEVADVLGIAPLLDRRPAELSGGQRQRVALGRAWVRRPDVFLLDEPFSSLQTPLRAELRQHLRTLQSSVKATTLLVSHDPEDLAGFEGRIAVMHAGKIVQITGASELRSGSAGGYLAECTQGGFGMRQIPFENERI
jgi:multiple sugar transport system ATP-binding protein